MRKHLAFFGFFISFNFDKNWNKISIGKSQSFYVINQEFNGYFDINELYVFSVIKNDLAPLLKAVEYLISMIETMRIEKDVDEHTETEKHK